MKPRIYNPTEKDFSHNGLGVLSDASRADIREAANGVYELEVEHPLKSRFKEYFENGYQIKVKPNDQEDYHVFEIKRTYEDTNGNNILIYAQSRTYKLGNREVQHVEINSQNGSGAMKLITAGMDQSSDIELFSDIQTVSSTVFEARNVLNCIAGEQGSLLQYWGGEIKREPFRLSLLRRRGRDKLGTVRYGKDLQGLKITFDWQSIITRCLPYADLQDSEDGQTKRIYGKKVDSELLKNYPDVYAKHIQFTEEQGVKDQASLDKAAAKYFISVNPGCDKPKVSIEVEFEKLTDSEEAKEFSKLRNYGLFDTFSVYHKLYDIHVEAKITEVLYDGLNEKVKKISAGDTQIAFYTQQNYEFQETIKTLTKKGYMSDFLDYVTNLINGVEGGSVLQYPKNKPHSTYYLDSDSRDTAKDVVVLNNQGIGFSRTGWLGPFVNAWGINGDLNADFIRVGRIRAKMMETSFNGVGDTLKLVGGLLQVYNKEKRIMELSKKGMEFWSDNGAIGTIGTTDSAGNPFKDASTPTPIPDNALVIRANGDGKYILISAVEKKGFIMLGNGTTIHNGDLNIQGKLRVFGDLDVQGKLTIKGREVFPGQGGGSSGSQGGQGNNWNGQYPPELTDDREKRYWLIWVCALAAGCTPEVAAALCGNAQGESDGNPRADESGGNPGYGYGLFQWTLKGVIGRVYMVQLMGQAGIKDDPDTSEAQMKLLFWHGPNGQWMSTSAYPYSWAQFLKMTDIAVATTAFEKNFERPLNSHPERIDYAKYWYNRFKDLKIPQANNDIVSVAKSLLGYFTYQLIHGERYIGSVQNIDRNGVTDCSGYVWLVLAKAGYPVPSDMQWYTGSMTSDARGAHQWLQEIAPEQSKAGDVIIYNVGGGAGANGHTAILLETYRGNDTQIIQMGGDSRFSGVNTSTMGYSFGSLLGGDRCIARAVK